MPNFLNDKEFLLQLDKVKKKQFYAKIMAVDKNNQVLEIIEGRITGGSVNIDGKSAIRRTCSLNITTYEETGDNNKIIITDGYWGLKNRFILYIGSQNDINTLYPNIVWFKQGLYVISGFNKTYNSDGTISISINGQDKMALLNGTLGGHFLSEVDLGTEEVYDKYNNVIVNKLPIKTILRNLLLVFAKENPENIIINDLEDYGWELWEYRGDKPLYLFYQPISSHNLSGEVINMTLDGDTIIDGQKISELEQYYSLNTLKPEYNLNATSIKYNEKDCKVVKIETGETAGYHKIDLVYNSDLILKAGDTITSALDKIKDMLVNFEYFYDIDGRFIFQKKKEKLQDFLISNSTQIISPTASTTSYSYVFDDLSTITNLSTPFQLDNIKNDFVIWGTKNDLPFHIRYAIDKKPIYYKTQIYNEKRELTYLKLNKYKDSGKCFIKKGNNYIESYTTEYEEESKYTLTYKKPENESQWWPVKDPENEVIIPQGKYQIELKFFNGSSIIDDTSITTAKDEIKFAFKAIRAINNQAQGKAEILFENYPIYLKIPYNIENKYLNTYISFNKENIGDYTECQLFLYPIKQQYTITETNSKNNNGLYYIKNNQYNYYLSADESIDNYKGIEENGQTPNINTGDAGKYYYVHLSKEYKTFGDSPVPWQEIIYQMANDYYKHNLEEDFLYRIQEDNILEGKRLYLYGKTGYEQYYQDIQGFWRLLYNPEEQEMWNGSTLQEYYDNTAPLDYQYWNKNVYNNSDNLIFWIEFLDFGDGAEFSKYSAGNIGQRTKVLNDSKINSILYKEIPEVQFIFSNKEIERSVTYNPILIQKNMENMFVRSSQGASAIEKMNNLLNEYVYYTNSLNFSTIPIWYLEPNSKIYIKDHGEYIIEGISYSLNYNTTMNIKCTQVPQAYA